MPYSMALGETGDLYSISHIANPANPTPAVVQIITQFSIQDVFGSGITLSLVNSRYNNRDFIPNQAAYSSPSLFIGGTKYGTYN